MTAAVETTAAAPAVAGDLNEAGLRSDEQRERWMILGLCGPSLFVVAVVMMVPVAWLFWLSFVGADGTMSWENYTPVCGIASHTPAYFAPPSRSPSSPPASAC
jgi:hypothetical protein